MADYFDMGGFAAFIWPAYGLTAAVLIGILALSLQRLRANRTALRELEALTDGETESETS